MLYCVQRQADAKEDQRVVTSKSVDCVIEPPPRWQSTIAHNWT